MTVPRAVSIVTASDACRRRRRDPAREAHASRQRRDARAHRPRPRGRRRGASSACRRPPSRPRRTRAPRAPCSASGQPAWALGGTRRARRAAATHADHRAPRVARAAVAADGAPPARARASGIGPDSRAFMRYHSCLLGKERVVCGAVRTRVRYYAHTPRRVQPAKRKTAARGAARDGALERVTGLEPATFSLGS